MQHATLRHEGPISTLTLQRESARNALSVELLSAMDAAVAEVEALLAAGEGRDATGAGEGGGPTVLILTGAGRAFCAGMDLKAVLGDEAGARALLTGLARLTHRLRALPCVTLAAVNGAAIGGGCGLATVCDLAITFDDNKMGFPEVDLGVCPAVVAPWLVRKIGPGRARRVLLSGGLMSGAQAAELGIVDRSVPTAAELPEAVRAAAQRLATGGRRALAATKGLLNSLDGSTDLDLLLSAADLSARVLASPEGQARLRAKLAGG